MDKYEEMAKKIGMSFLVNQLIIQHQYAILCIDYGSTITIEV